MTAPPRPEALVRWLAMDANQRAMWARAAGPAGVLELIEAVRPLALADPARAVAATDALPEIARHAGGARLESAALTARADALAWNAQLAEANQTIERAIALAESVNAGPELGRALLVAVQPLGRSGRLHDAVASARRAGETYRALGDEVGAAKAAVNEGVTLRQLGEADAAIAAFERALPVFSDAPGVQAQIESNLAEALLELNRFELAEAAFTRAHDLFESAGVARAAGVALGNLADLLGRQGRLSESMRAFERAVRLLEGAAPPADVARLRAEYAEVLAAAGLADQALDALESAAPVLQEATLVYEHARATVALALLLANAGRLPEADGLLAAALRGPAARDPAGLSRLAFALAHVRSLRGELDDAATGVLHQALNSLNELPADHARLATLLARVELQRRGDLTQASAEHLERAVAAARNLGMAALLPAAVHTLALLRMRQGPAAKASELLDEAMACVENVRGRLPGESTRIAFIGAHLAAYHDAIALRLESGSPRAAHQAFAIAERMRSRALLDRVRGALEVADQASASNDPAQRALLEQRQGLQRDLNALYSRLDDRAFGTGARAQAWLAEVREHERRLGAVEASLAAGGFHRDVLTPALEAPAIAASLPAGTALLAYVHLSHAQAPGMADRLVAMMLGPEGLRGVRVLGPGKDVARLTSRLALQMGRGLVRASAGEFASPAHASTDEASRRSLVALGASLLEPVADLLGDAHRLIIVPDGPVHDVPFEALWLDGAHVVERMAVRYASSGSVHVALRDHRPPRPSAARNLAIGIDDPGAAAMREEALAAASAIDGCRALVGEEATAEALLHAAGEADVIHIASHALPPDAGALTGRLRMADRWVDTRELTSGRLRARWVVLSGCETGRGVGAGGEGVLGLVRGLLAAGAGTVIATRWPLEDVAAAWLARELHIRIARGEQDALAATQRHAIEHGMHPALWATYFAMGEHR